jgi:single-stranded-DNA-specific exonuclease
VGQPLGKALFEARGEVVHAAGQLAVDRWQGAERVQLRLADIGRPAGRP